MGKFETDLIKVLAVMVFMAMVTAKSAPVVKNVGNSVSNTFSNISDSVFNKNKTVTASEPFELQIEKIKLRAPIIAGVDDTNKENYLKAIENGVALSKNQAKSPTYLGNMFIFGHSSYYRDKPGNYKEVFKDLHKVAKNDLISIQFQGKTYSYKVKESKQVGVKDFSIIIPNRDNPRLKTLTLMTCWPIGSTEKRWVVLAEQI